MNIEKFTLRKKALGFILVFLTMLTAGQAWGQAVGDYGTRYNNGTATNWATANNWVVCVTSGTWTGATVANAVPNNTKNVWIRDGANYIMNANPGSCNNIDIQGTLTLANRNITISGTTTISGTLNDNNDGGSNTFTGLVTINNGGTLSTANSSPFSFNGGITNNGTFSQTGTGAVTLSGNQTITGTGAMSFSGTVTVANNITVTNTNTGGITFNNVLNGGNGTSTWINSTNGVINYQPNVTTQPMNTGVLTATASGNIVNYSRDGAQTGKVTTYNNLTLSGSGVKTFATTPTVNGILSMEGTATIVVTTGVVAYGASATLQYNTNTDRTVTSEEWITPFTASGGVVIANTGTITLNAAKAISSVLTVNSGATLFCGNNNITGTGTFTLSSGGTLGIGSAAGISASGATGNIQTNTRNFNTGANYLYNGTTTPQAAGSGLPSTVNNLIINNSATNGQVTMGGNITINGTLTLTNGDLVTGSNYVHVTNPATDAIGGYNANSYIYGTLRRTLDATGSYVFPIGEAANYRPFEMVNVTGGSSPVISASVSSSPAATTIDGTMLTIQPRNWNVQVISGTFTSAQLRLSESVGAGYTIASSSAATGAYTNVASTWTTGTPLATLLSYYTFSDATLPSYFAIGTPVIPTYYSYQNGNWNNPAVWTLDPSGTTWVNWGTFPSSANDATILNGRTVTATAAIAAKQLNVEEGGVLDIATYAGTFTTVIGSGVIRLNNTVFPTGNFTAFTNAGGGTIEYYNAAAFNFPVYTYNNLSLDLGAIGTMATVLSNLTLNGSLTIKKGTLRINNGATSQLDLTVKKDVLVQADGRIVTGTGSNAATGAHRFIIQGNFTNNGEARFSNLVAANYLTQPNDRIDVVFNNGSTDQDVLINGLTQFYRIEVDKGTDQTYILNIDATANNLFYLFGVNNTMGVTPSPDAPNINNTNALGLMTGTLRLGKNIVVPSLAEENNNTQDLNYHVDEDACLWIDGATVTHTTNVNGGNSNSFVLYGKLKITNAASSFNVNNLHGIVMRANAAIEIHDGTLSTPCIRTSTIAGTHRGTYYQTGGTVTITGNITGADRHPSLSMTYENMGFKMTGGTLNIEEATSGGEGNAFSMVVGANPQNISVTGGTIKITARNRNANFATTVPFYNLILDKVGAYSTNNTTFTSTASDAVTVAARSMVVTNDFNLVNSATYVANNLDVTIGGDFIIPAGATYIPGTNTTTFNGASGQEFQINGTITGGLQNLTLSNTTATVITATTPKTLTVNGTLTISALCSLEDYGNIISARGTVYNSGTHISNNGEAGRIVLSGNTTQQIQGDGNGIFGNLEIANTVAAGTDAARFYADQTITNTLSFTIARGILNIDKYRLNLYNNTANAILFSGGAASANKMIKTAGNQSDGGVFKIFDVAPNNTFTFPVGTSSGYTPASFTVATATSYGNITVKPTSKEHPLAINTNNTLQRYWKVESEYFSGIGTVTSSFSYVDSDVEGGAANDADYYAAVYNPYTWTKNNVTPTYVVPASNIINFENSIIDGEYTAGQTDAFPTTLPVFYSRVNNGDWGTASTWSNSVDRSTTASRAPTTGDPVVIGGNGFNHTIVVSSDNTYAGSLVINSGSVLDIGTFTGHNFGTLPNQQVGGTGKLRISSSAVTAEFPAGDFGIFIGNSGGVVEYYTNGTSFTLPITSAAPTNLSLSNYYNLNLMAAGGNTITLPNIDMVVYNDLSTGGTGFTNNVLLNASTARSLTINNNLNVNAGRLQFQNGTVQTLTVGADVNIASGAVLEVLTNGNAVANTVTISGNLTNNGTLSLYNFTAGITRYCNLIFKGNTDNSFTGTNPLATTTLNMLAINKGTTQSSVLTMDVAGTLNVLNNNWLSLTNGTFRFAKAGSTITLTNNSNTFTIPATACLSVNAAGAVVNIGNNANDASDLLLNGKLEVKTGTVNIGQVGFTTNNDIEYASAGTPEISIETGGVLNVNGQIRYSNTMTTGSLIYNQTGGDVTIRGRNYDDSRAKLAVHNPGSIFNMSGGTINILRGGGTDYSDLYIRPTASTVTGGTIIFNASGLGNQTYKIDATTPLFSVSLIGTAGNTATLNQNVSDLVLLGSLTIGTNTTLISNNLNLAIGGNFTKSGTYTHGNNTTTFNGNGAQDITLNNATTFNNLTIDKNSGTVSLLGTFNPTVNGIFSLLNGTFDTKARNIYAFGNVVNSGTHVSTGTGVFFIQGRTVSGDGTGSFANITINNLNNVEFETNITITKQLNFQNGMLHLDDNMLTFTTTAPDPTGFATNRFITTNGVSSDGGIRKMLPGGDGTFTLPIGALASGVNKYTPVSYTFTGVDGANPFIQVRPINMKHYATTDVANKELAYYWNITVPDDFAATTLTQVYTYLQSDADGRGTETSYIGGRLPLGSLVWQPDGSVNTSNNTITFTNLTTITGNYTAGESSEFLTSPKYRSRASGNWNDYTTWEKNTDGTGVGYTACLAGDYPIENQVFIQAGHTVTATENGYKSIYLNLEGVLDLGTTNSHNFISLVGNGRLKIDQNNYNAFIFPGGDNTVFMNTVNSTIEYYSSNPAILPIIATYQNLDLSGAGTKAIPNLELTIKGNLTMMTGCGQVSNATYNRSINLKGNWVNNTANPFVPGSSNITFNGTAAQQIGGVGTIASPGETFYNLVVTNPAGLTLGREINIKNNLTINSGSSLSGGANTINIQGNWINNSTTKFIAGTSTVNFNGSTTQTYVGATGETFNNIIINNTNGVTANCATTLNGNITFVANNGKLMIGAYPLTLTNTADNIITGAGASKFIQTNGLASDAGVIKSVTGSYNFKFEVGTGSKYTPAQFNETGAGGTGTIKVIPVKNKHPFANNNLSDELKYYWIVQAGGSLTPTSVTHTYTFVAEDAVPNATSYVTGRFYNGNWAPVEGGEAGTTVSSPTMTFTAKAYLNGEYTCGLASNFKTVSIYYSRDNAPLISSGADWRNLKTWSTKGHSDNIYIPNTIPNANSVIIKAGHKVVSYDDGITITDLTLNGELNVNATASHDFGSVTGTGKLIVKNNASKVFVLPTANYNSFTASTGGTIEYNGDGDLPDQATYNNLILSAAGAKNMPNQNMVINGNLQIANGQLNNGFGKDINIKKNWVDNVSDGGFTSLAGKVIFNGTVAQTITTNVVGKFYNLEINNSSGITLNSPVEVTNNLILTNGKINTTTINTLLLSNSNSDIVSGAGLGTSSYVVGPLNKNIASTGSFVFPIGTAAVYHPATVLNADADVWQAQYYTGAYNASNYVSPIGAVSNTEYWRIQSATASSTAKVSLPYNNSGIASKWVVVMYSPAGTPLWNNDLGSTITTATTSVATNNPATFNTFGTGNYFTIGSSNLYEWVGGVSSDWADVNNWSVLLVPGSTDNVKIPVVSGSNVYPIISSGTPICYNLTNDGTFTLTGGNLNIYGNWTNNGTFTASASSIVSFVGSTNQTIGGTNPSIFYDLVVNNTGAAGNDLITLNQPTTVNYSMTFTDGVISSSASNLLIFSDGATSSTGNQTGPSFVYGPVKKIGNEDFTFPVGDIQGTDYVWEPLGINNTAGSATDEFTTTYFYTPSTNNDESHRDLGIHHTSYIEMWDVTRDNGSSTPPVTLYWTNGDRSKITDITPGYDLCVAHYNGSTSKWENMGSTSISGTLASGSITTTVPFTSYSPITFGSLLGVNPLPVGLVEFKAIAQDGFVNCTWTTYSETNNDYFEVQHAIDGTNFQPIGTVKGNGNSTEPKYYIFNDNNPVRGINYYRLKQVDFDGKYETFDVVKVYYNGNKLNLNSAGIRIIPNPYKSGDLHLELIGFEPAAPVQLTIYDISGKLVYNVHLTVPDDQLVNLIPVAIDQLNKGVYLIQVSGSKVQHNQKLIID